MIMLPSHSWKLNHLAGVGSETQNLSPRILSDSFIVGVFKNRSHGFIFVRQIDLHIIWLMLIQKYKSILNASLNSVHLPTSLLTLSNDDLKELCREIEEVPTSTLYMDANENQFTIHHIINIKFPQLIDSSLSEDNIELLERVGSVCRFWCFSK